MPTESILDIAQPDRGQGYRLYNGMLAWLCIASLTRDVLEFSDEQQEKTLPTGDVFKRSISIWQAPTAPR